VRNILRNGTKGAQTRIISPALAKASISVQLVVVHQPKERATARGSSIMPNVQSKSIIVQVGVEEGVTCGCGERRGRKASDMAVTTIVRRQLNVGNQGR